MIIKLKLVEKIPDEALVVGEEAAPSRRYPKGNRLLIPVE